MLINQHCQICEFNESCREKAIKDGNLSLLGKIGAKEALFCFRKTANYMGLIILRDIHKGCCVTATVPPASYKAPGTRETMIFCFQIHYIIFSLSF